MWSLAAPLALLLLPAPLLFRRLLPPWRFATAALYVPPALAETVTAGERRSAAALVWRVGPALLWVLLVVALAGPRALTTTELAPASGRDVMLALDLSGSMENEDFELDGEAISRLAAVKRVAAAFTLGRVGDRLGLVVFGDRAYVAAPLTFDVGAVARAIEEVEIGVSGRSTAISDGVGLALKRLSTSESPSRVIVMLSDGVDTTSKVTATGVAALARRHGVRIHTIALGPEDLETAPRSRDAVDVATLRAVAEESGGESFRVRTMDDLAAMAASLDRLEPNPTRRAPLEAYRDRWPVPAAAAFAVAVALAWARRSR
jgi:Ca-activated chloride channel homolog